MERLTEKDLAMYFDCEAMLSNISKRMVLESWEEGKVKIGGYLLNYYSLGDCDLKPILRPLSDITEEEKIEIIKAKYPSLKIKSVIIYNEFYTAKVEYFSEHLNDWLPSVVNGFLGPEQFKYLISKGFDLFGYIEKGLAIDKTKL